MLTLLLACKEPKENINPIPKTLFTLNVAADYPTANKDNWIFIHNEAGELIDYKPFESGQNLKFETTKNTSLS